MEGLVKKDLANTSNLSIAPISYAFSFLVTYIEEGADSVAFKNVLDRVNDPVFHGPQGMTVMGTNGSQTWDASSMVQYFMMAGLADIPKYQPMIRKAYEFLVRSQFTDECVPGSFRDRRKGGWPFSTKDQGFVVSDCTAEALKAIIMVRNHPAFPDVTKVDEQNLYDAVEVLLGLQNVGSFEFGSFASYERIKATPLLEKLNPAEVFNMIMVEYPYVECTDSSVLGLRISINTFRITSRKPSKPPLKMQFSTLCGHRILTMAPGMALGVFASHMPRCLPLRP